MYEIFGADGKRRMQATQTGWPAGAAIVVNFPTAEAKGRYRFVIHHVASAGDNAENIDDVVSFLVP